MRLVDRAKPLFSKFSLISSLQHLLKGYEYKIEASRKQKKAEIEYGGCGGTDHIADIGNLESSTVRNGRDEGLTW